MTVANLKDLDLSALRDMKMLRRWVFLTFWQHSYIIWSKSSPWLWANIGWCDPHWALALLQAVDDMNGKELNGRQVYVGRAQKKGERQNELKRKFEQMKQDRMTRYQVNRIFFSRNWMYLDLVCLKLVGSGWYLIFIFCRHCLHVWNVGPA